MRDQYVRALIDFAFLSEVLNSFISFRSALDKDF